MFRQQGTHGAPAGPPTILQREAEEAAVGEQQRVRGSDGQRDARGGGQRGHKQFLRAHRRAWVDGGPTARGPTWLCRPAVHKLPCRYLSIGPCEVLGQHGPQHSACSSLAACMLPLPHTHPHPQNAAHLWQDALGHRHCRANHVPDVVQHEALALDHQAQAGGAACKGMGTGSS